jgi:drug/metabolite transporter (DMT)-like permease
MPRDRDVLLGTLAAVCGASLFGMLGTLSRFGADAGVPGVAFTAWRAALGVLALALLIGLRGRASGSVAALRGLGTRGRRSLAIASLAGVVLNVSMFTAFSRIPIALTLMLFYTYPAGVAAVDVWLGHERVTPMRVLALLLAMAGVVLVLAGGPAAVAGGAPDGIGIGLALLAAASQVVFMTVSRNGYRSVPTDAATLVILATSAGGATVIALVVGQGGGLTAPFRSADPWPMLLLGGVAAAAISSMLFLTAIRKLGSTRAGILMLLEPVVGVIIAAIWLHESLGPVQALGGGLVLAGALVLQLRSDPDLEPVLEAGAGPMF